jgi:radical SAM-linked protein
VVSLYVNLANFSKPSRYINNEIHSLHFSGKNRPEVSVALAFPDIYDIGMSHLGLKILYKIINDLPYAAAERVFAPWSDMESYLRDKGKYLCSLETGRSLREFNIVGFSLQYELSYTTVMNMLDLGGIPVKRHNRDESSPLVIAGGPCSVNPAPLSHYIDAFLIGDTEENVTVFLDTFRETEKRRDLLLKELSRIDGVYVPEYSKGKTRRMFLSDLDSAPYPTSPVVPYRKTVHDRINIEVSRGCSRACRFCQAGTIYRPVRERSAEHALALAEETIKNTGYDEVSFTSLSAGDYSQLIPLLKEFNRRFAQKKISVSLPSLRVGAVNASVLNELRSVRKSGFTIAPEAATERLRSVINKDFSQDEYDAALYALFGAGWQTIKLYFMIGLPTETWNDIEEIITMARKARKIARDNMKRRININVGISPFVPKPHTPFQWLGQEEISQLREKKMFIMKHLGKKSFTIKSHNEQMSLLEASISRGDQAIGELIEAAWRCGSRLDAWSEYFDFSVWEEAMNKTGIDAAEYAYAHLVDSEELPWDMIDTGIKNEFLKKELSKATGLKKTPGCSVSCHLCGLECNSGQFLKGISPVKRSSLHGRSPGKFSPVKVRVEFSKKGTLRYLSHLEVVSTILRALRRADIPLRYSEGFRPSPKVSFGPALGVGIEGESEFFDMEVYPPFALETTQDTVNHTLPEGMAIKKMIFIGRSLPSLNEFINCYEYEIGFRDSVPIKRFAEYMRANKGTDAMVLDSAIINDTTLKIRIREVPNRKTRISDLIVSLCGVPAGEARTRRTGMWGIRDGLVSPMDTARESKMSTNGRIGTKQKQPT